MFKREKLSPEGLKEREISTLRKQKWDLQGEVAELREVESMLRRELRTAHYTESLYRDTERPKEGPKLREALVKNDQLQRKLKGLEADLASAVNRNYELLARPVVCRNYKPFCYGCEED